jgi:hypothetical protein
MLALTITNEQKIPVALSASTEAGFPASVPGVPTWTVLSGLSTIVVAEDGLSAFLVSADVADVTVVEITAGDLVDTIELTVVMAAAAQLVLTAGEAVLK